MDNSKVSDQHPPAAHRRLPVRTTLISDANDPGPRAHVIIHTGHYEDITYT